MIVICFFSLTLYASREKEYKKKSSDFPSCCGLIQVQNRGNLSEHTTLEKILIYTLHHRKANKL